VSPEFRPDLDPGFEPFMPNFNPTLDDITLAYKYIDALQNASIRS
jgi:hypothetical protein